MSMQPAEYQKALSAAEEEIADILHQKFQLDHRLNQLKQTVDALSALVEDMPAISEIYAAVAEGSPSAVGITGGIRRVLMDSKVPMSPVQVRNELMKRGFDLSEYANKMAVVHNTLKRLDAQGELMTVRDSGGHIVAYTTRWQGDSEVGTPPSIENAFERSVREKK